MAVVTNITANTLPQTKLKLRNVILISKWIPLFLVYTSYITPDFFDSYVSFSLALPLLKELILIESNDNLQHTMYIIHNMYYICIKLSRSYATRRPYGRPGDVGRDRFL